jgi:hypothetical protein
MKRKERLAYMGREREQRRDTLFPMMSKEETKKYHKSKSQAHEVREGLFKEGIQESQESLRIKKEVT